MPKVIVFGSSIDVDPKVLKKLMTPYQVSGGRQIGRTAHREAFLSKYKEYVREHGGEVTQKTIWIDEQKQLSEEEIVLMERVMRVSFWSRFTYMLQSIAYRLLGRPNPRVSYSGHFFKPNPNSNEKEI